jgi:hypothetical protein
MTGHTFDCRNENSVVGFNEAKDIRIAYPKAPFAADVAHLLLDSGVAWCAQNADQDSHRVDINSRRILASSALTQDNADKT